MQHQTDDDGASYGFNAPRGLIGGSSSRSRRWDAKTDVENGGNNAM